MAKAWLSHFGTLIPCTLTDISILPSSKAVAFYPLQKHFRASIYKIYRHVQEFFLDTSTLKNETITLPQDTGPN